MSLASNNQDGSIFVGDSTAHVDNVPSNTADQSLRAVDASSASVGGDSAASVDDLQSAPKKTTAAPSKRKQAVPAKKEGVPAATKRQKTVNNKQQQQQQQHVAEVVAEVVEEQVEKKTEQVEKQDSIVRTETVDKNKVDAEPEVFIRPPLNFRNVYTRPPQLQLIKQRVQQAPIGSGEGVVTGVVQKLTPQSIKNIKWNRFRQ